ncbi:hypothetical protein CRE_11431 [Caenorhabditis remanei]|uniref:F-box domain-containing protein n=1 Tax=Caenorhabditis remanei TaxID=31234 RepID=E3NBG2_CAERE|nr:hypothetical protein CRE_11431 [Caenorhabditis remanei]
MTNIDPNSPANLRALMLYDISQRKTMRESIENHRVLCQTLGKKAILYDEYECRFNRCLNENYHSAIEKRDLPIPDFLVCILSNVINRKSAEKSIDDLCDAFKNHKIDKEDHEYWYKRFGSGHLFSRATFSDLPDKVLGEIVEKCDLNSYLNLREVSNSLRAIVEEQTPPCSDIKVILGYDHINIFVNDEPINDSYDFGKVFGPQKIEDMKKRMFEILTIWLRNPKLRLKSFTLYNYLGAPLEWVYSKSKIEFTLLDYRGMFFDLLNSVDNKIHAEKFEICMPYEKEVVEILQCFKPRTLKELVIFTNGRERELMHEIVKMDQWKQAKHLKLHGFILPPIENFYHFTIFELGYQPISMENLIKICDNASKSTNFVVFMLKTTKEMNTDEIKRVLILRPITPSQMYSIRNLNLVIQFQCAREDGSIVHVVKINKVNLD